MMGSFQNGDHDMRDNILYVLNMTRTAVYFYPLRLLDRMEIALDTILKDHLNYRCELLGIFTYLVNMWC